MFNFSRENTSNLAKWWRNVDKQILLSIVLLFLLGLFFSFSSTSSLVGEKLNKETYYLFLKHLVFVLVSLFLLIFISIQENKKIIKLLTPLFIISIFFLLLVPLLGVEVKGSKRWIQFLFFPRFQPIELVKPMFILFVAKTIMLNDGMKIHNRYVISFFSLFIIIVLLVNQPDLGQSLLLILSWLAMIFVSGFNMFILIILVLISITVFIGLIYFLPS